MTTQKKILDLTGAQYLVQTIKGIVSDINTAISSKANDSDVVHKTGDETIAGVKTFSNDTYIKSLKFTSEVASQSSSGGSTLPLIATVTYTGQTASKSARINLRISANGTKTFYPHEDNQYALGTASKKWSEVRAYKYYYGNSDIEFSDKFVTTDTNQTVSGGKTFSKYITSDGSSTGDEYSPNARTNLWLMGNRDTEEVSGILFDTYRQNTAQGTGAHILGISIKENSVRYEGCRFSWGWKNDLNGYSFDFKPTTQGTNQALKHNLGTSTDKWSEVHATTYYYGSSDTEFSQKFVTTDTDQTISGVKTFADVPIFTSFDGIRFRCAHNPNAYVTFRNANQANPGSIILSAHDGNVNTAIHLVDKTLIPYTNDIDLGTTSRKWRTFNGLEPSSLGMPDLSNGIDISSYITTGDTNNNYTPPANGWIWIRLIGNGASIIQGDFGVNANYVTNNLTNEKWVETCLFVTKDVQATIRCRNITGIVGAKFYPCLGNV